MRQSQHGAHRFSKKTKILLACLAVFIVLGLISPLVTTEYTIYSPVLPPAFDGFKILQISDLQNSTDPHILQYAQKMNPDLIVLTGDTFYTKTSPSTYGWTLALMKQLTRIAPVYAVSGNHDLWNQYFTANQLGLKEAGVGLLENTYETIQRGDAAIRIMGISDPDTLDKDKSRTAVLSFLQQVKSTDGFDILLFHRADMLDILKNKGFDLILSGHLHGGQFRLPYLGGLVTPDLKLFPRYSAGVYSIDGSSTAVVSRGIGNTTVFPRFFNPPELVLVTLRSLT